MPRAFSDSLPIDEVLGDIAAATARFNRLVVSAPPGAGKTTRLPLALMDQDWAAAGKLVLVEPRRIAARAAAERLAGELGSEVGGLVGLRSRLDVRTSKDARIEVVTEGVFTRMILSDPGLDGVSAVLFDEFHERSLDADTGLAFALDAQAGLRDDLRILVMSATLDVSSVASFLDAPSIASEGRAHPVETRYLGGDVRARVEDLMTDAILKALHEETGSVLAFLPGVAEIRRTADRLEERIEPSQRGGVILAPLYGALSPADQTAAIRPPPAGQRKIVLATDIAESALTIEGVRVVVDSGLRRVPRFDSSIGVSRLDTVRVAQSNADQRRGRAGRLGPGVCYRLWREAETRSFAPDAEPEILNADLSGLALDLARWGVARPEALSWLTPPPATGWKIAVEGLRAAGALDADGRLTDLGRRLGNLALPPRLAMMVQKAAATGDAEKAAQIAAILSERDLGGRSTDLDDRLRRFADDRDPRSRAMRDLAGRWARAASGSDRSMARPLSSGASAAELLAAAFPDRIARARAGAIGRFVLAGGRGALIDETDPLAREPWLVVADLAGAGPDLRIKLAARMANPDELSAKLAQTSETLTYDPATTGVRARRVRRLGAIVLEETPLPAPSRAATAAALLNAVQTNGLEILPAASALQGLTSRVAFLAQHIGDPWPSDFPALLVERLDEWLAPLLANARTLSELPTDGVAAAALASLDWPLSRDLASLAPEAWTTPVGRRVAIDYAAPGGPLASCKVQEAFGPAPHPMLAGGRVALAVELLSPAMRPVALTRDLPGFWRGGYADMRKDMRGRYPKHDWPDDPAAAQATSRAKPRP